MLALTSRRRCIVMQTCLKPNSPGRPALHDAATDEDAGITALLVRYATEYVAAETARLHLAAARCRKYLVVEARVWFVYSSEFVTDWGGRAASHDAVREHNPPMVAPLPRLGAVERLEDNASPRHALSSLRGVLARRVYEARSSKPYGGGRNDGRRLVQRAFKRTATPTDALESGELPTLKAPMMCIMSAGFKRVGMALGCLCGSWGG